VVEEDWEIEAEAIEAEEMDGDSELVVSFVLWASGMHKSNSRFAHMQTYAPIVGIAWAHSQAS
jgi:hypothetical protein